MSSNDPPSPNATKSAQELESRVYSATETNSIGSSHGHGRGPRIKLDKGEDKLIAKFLVFLSYIVVIVCFPFSLFFIFTVNRQFERGVILRNGKIYKKRPIGPGLVHYLPRTDIIKYTDLRVISYAVPYQEERSNVSYHVNRTSTQFLAAITLRNALGTRKLTEILAKRPEVSFQVFSQMKNIARDWGIKIDRVEIKDIKLPLQLQKAMATEAESSRLANSKIIVAKAEIESTKHLQLATATYMDNPMCMQLRYLQSLQSIAGEKTHTIVFPYSSDLVKKLFDN